MIAYFINFSILIGVALSWTLLDHHVQCHNINLEKEIQVSLQKTVSTPSQALRQFHQVKGALKCRNFSEIQTFNLLGTVHNDK